MITKIDDTYINLDKIQYIQPFKDAKGAWVIKVQFAPSGYKNIGRYGGKDTADEVITEALLNIFKEGKGFSYVPPK